MTITTNDVQKIAKLVKLDVTGQEEKLAKMFSETLDYVDILKELDTTTTAKTYQVSGTVNIFQQSDAESANTTLTQEQSLQNAKKSAENLFETAAVFDR